MKNNLVNLSDSYKYSHYLQYPKGTQIVHSYLESRGGQYDSVVFFGLLNILKEYLVKPITKEDVAETAALCAAHGEPFNKEGWMYIVDYHDGYLPVVIKAVPEGMVLKPHNVMLTVENTDPMVPWVTSFLETLLLKVWYPITIASKSYAVRKMLEKHHTATMDNIDGVAFAFHNFGDRGSSSVESAAIGGVAHLTQFMGTDNFNCLTLARDVYGATILDNKLAGFSIPASEHSTVTSWGRDGEFDMIRNYLEKSKGQGMIACVLDSYNIYNAVEFVTTELKDKIESNEYPIFVIRPDSGEPIEVIGNILRIMKKSGVAYTTNSKGFKQFNKYRIIWGDGITPEVINEILNYTTSKGYAAGNFAFGSGGDLMQNVNRDTCKFAIKCSAIVVNNVEREVYKDPITDKGKASKKGRQTLIKWKTRGWSNTKTDDIQTIALKNFNPELHEEVLVEVFRDGRILKRQTLIEIRSLSREG